MEISVIIPTYNRCESLKNALASVTAQKGPSFEIIVVDDGSEDGTRKMLAREFPGIRYEYQENQGPAAARNTGIALAQGKWIAFLDSDDIWLPGKLLAQAAYFSEHPQMRICQTEEIWIRNGKRVNPMKKHQKYGGLIFNHCLGLCLISPSAVMLEKQLLEETGGFDESYPACEDYELWLRISARCEVGLIPKAFVKKFGGHDDQLSHTFPAMDRFRIKAIAGVLKSNILTAKQADEAKKVLSEKAAIFLNGAKKRKNESGIKEVLQSLKDAGLTLSV